MNRSLVILFVFVKMYQTFSNPILKPGSYEQWRVKLPFYYGDEMPLCQENCGKRCGTELKGVAICGSFLESILSEDVTRFKNDSSKTQNTTQVILTEFLEFNE